MQRTGCWIIAAWCLTLACIGLRSDIASAQNRFSAPAESVFAPPPRSLTRVLSESTNAIEEKRYSDALAALYALLNDESEDIPAIYRGQDYFLANDNSGNELSRPTGSIRGQADQILASLPKEARETLAVQYGVSASKALEEALENDDWPAVEFVTREFPHTDAAYDAWVLLARRSLLAGQPLEAAFCYYRLLKYPYARTRFGTPLGKAALVAFTQAGQSNKALEVAENLPGYFRGDSIDLDGRQVELSSSTDWKSLLANSAELRELPVVERAIADWPTLGGGPERVAMAKTGMPIPSVRWVAKIHSNKLEKTAIDSYRESQTRDGKLLLPRMSLRLARNYVLTKTTDDVTLGIDFDTGNIKWLLPQTSAILPSSSRSQTEIAPPEVPSSELQRRVWNSPVYGQFSTDRRRVYTIRQPQSGRRQFNTTTSNYLVAYNIDTEGEELWTAGDAPTYGASQAIGDPPELRDAWFLGPPLPIDEELFCIVESRGQIVLVSLDASTGKVLWRQNLAKTPAPSVFNRTPQFRQRLLCPSYSDGVLVCPTGVGAIVAVDRITRTLRWGEPHREPPSGSRFGSPSNSVSKESEGWFDSRVLVRDGVVVATPGEGKSLYCLDLDSGLPLREPIARGELIYPVAVWRDEVVAVSDRRLMYFNVRLDRSRAGPPFPGGRKIAGRGLFMGEELLLPLGTHTIARVDTRSGEMLEAVEVNEQVGNLFSYKGNLLTVNETEVAAYYTREALDRTIDGSDPDAPQSLNLKSLLALADDNTLNAIILLEQALERDPHNTETQYLMAEALVEGLEEDYPRFRELAIKYEHIVHDRTLKDKLVQLLALGDISAEAYRPAFERLMELVENQSAETFSPTQFGAENIQVDEKLSIDSDTWIASTLARAYERSPPEQQVELAAMVVARGSKIRDRAVAYRRRQLAFLRFLPPAHPFILELADDLYQLREYTAAEQALQPVLTSGSRENRDEALKLLSNVPVPELQRLSVFGGGALAQFSVRELPEQVSAAPRIDEVDWNDGMVNLSVSGQPPNRATQRLPLRSERWGREPISVALRDSMVAIYNGLGESIARIRYPTTVPEDNQHSLDRAWIRGGLLFIETAAEIVAFDMLRAFQNRPDALLWRQPLSGVTATTQAKVIKLLADTRLGFTHTQRAASFEIAVGPLTTVGVPVQSGSTLVMKDLLTGKVLWTRTGYRVELQMVCQGDELAVIESATGQQAIEVLSIRDGTVRRRFLKEAMPVATWFVCDEWVVDVDEIQASSIPNEIMERPYGLRIWSPFDESTELKLDLEPGSRCQHAGFRYIAAVEPSGRLHTLDLKRFAKRNSDAAPATSARDSGDSTEQDFEGHLIQEIPKQGSVLDTIGLEPVGDKLLVLGNYRGAGNRVRANALYQVDGVVRRMHPVHGYVFAVDRESLKLAWPKPVEAYNMSFPIMQPRTSNMFALYRGFGANAVAALVRTSDGRMACQHTFEPEYDSFAMRVSPLQQRITIDAGGRRLSFELTDQPTPPEPVAYISP